MIPGIVLLFYRSPLFIRAWEIFFNENNVHFIYRELTFFFTRSELKYYENFHDILLFVLETECYYTHNFCKINSLRDGAKT